LKFQNKYGTLADGNSRSFENHNGAITAGFHGSLQYQKSTITAFFCSLVQNGAITAGSNQNSVIAANVVSLGLFCEFFRISLVVYSSDSQCFVLEGQTSLNILARRMIQHNQPGKIIKETRSVIERCTLQTSSDANIRRLKKTLA
jgi:hypothetical protein